MSLLMKNRLCFDCLGIGGLNVARKLSVMFARDLIPLPCTETLSFQGLLPLRLRLQCLLCLHRLPQLPLFLLSVVTCDTMPIIPVKIKLCNSDNEIATYAFLDTGSSDTIITEQLMAQLNARGQRTNVNITTLHGCDVPTSCVAVSGLEVCGYGE